MIGDSSAAAIYSSLSLSSTLSDLNLAWNELHGAAMVTICEALTASCTLSNLELSWNPLGEPVSESISCLLVCTFVR